MQKVMKSVASVVFWGVLNVTITVVYSLFHGVWWLVKAKVKKEPTVESQDQTWEKMCKENVDSAYESWADSVNDSDDEFSEASEYLVPRVEKRDKRKSKITPEQVNELVNVLYCKYIDTHVMRKYRIGVEDPHLRTLRQIHAIYKKSGVPIVETDIRELVVGYSWSLIRKLM